MTPVFVRLSQSILERISAAVHRPRGSALSDLRRLAHTV
jgi:hypothetical protein